MPLDDVDVCSLTHPFLRRVVELALHHLRMRRPPVPFSCYHLSLLDLRVRVPSSLTPLPLIVCRLWPSALFSGHRQAEAAEAEVQGFDLWYTRTTGHLVCEAQMEQTDSLTVEDDDAVEEAEQWGAAAASAKSSPPILPWPEPSSLSCPMDPLGSTDSG